MTKQTLKALEKKYGENSMEYDIWLKIQNYHSAILIYPAIDSVMYLKKKFLKYDVETKHEPGSQLDYEQGCFKTVLRVCDEIIDMFKSLSQDDIFMKGGRYCEDLWFNWIMTFFLKIGKLTRFLEATV